MRIVRRMAVMDRETLEVVRAILEGLKEQSNFAFIIFVSTESGRRKRDSTKAVLI